MPDDDDDWVMPGDRKKRPAMFPGTRSNTYSSYNSRKRSGSFDITCMDCNNSIVIHRDGKEHNTFRGHNKTPLQPPVAHRKWKAACLLAAAEEIAKEEGHEPYSATFGEILREAVWGDSTNLGPSHTGCNAKHLGGDPSWNGLTRTEQTDYKRYVAERLRMAQLI